jgi:putative Mg2+ transporter-C (MgtC) family protein
MTDLNLQLELALRLVVAAVLGALIGLEREYHDHPAGMRTHLLVSVGSATFTVLSIEAFKGPGADPARIAAQIVTGIGFLGAGAILKDSGGIRGLTTAASLWAVAAVGMAAGAAAWGVAGVATVIVLVSLWPLGEIERRYVAGRTRVLRRCVGSPGPPVGRCVLRSSTYFPARPTGSTKVEPAAPGRNLTLHWTDAWTGLSGW